MKIGIVIINYNSYKETIECVQSIKKNCKANYKIIIVDNASQNDSFEKLYTNFYEDSSIEIIKSDINKGYSGGCNIGIKYAISDGCERIIISNNDILYTKNSIESMSRVFDENKDVGVVGPKVCDEFGEVQMGLKGTLNFWNALMSKKPFKYFDIFGLNKRLLFSDYDYKQLIEFKGMVAGCCFMISSNTINKIGLLDENIFLFYEEDAIALQLEQVRLKAYLQPESTVIHTGSLTIGQSSPFYFYHRYFSFLYVMFKYARVNSSQLLLFFIINYSSLFIKSLKNPDYNAYRKRLFKEYKKMKKGYL